MAYYNAIDTTEDGQRKHVHSENEIRILSLLKGGELKEKCYQSQKSGKMKQKQALEE